METTRDRILQYIKYKGDNKAAFYTKTGLSNGFLDKTLNPGSDKLDKILNAYPKLNLYWLIGRGGDMEVQLEIAPIAAPITAPNADFIALNKRIDELEGMITNIDMHRIEETALKVAVNVATKVASLRTWSDKTPPNVRNGRQIKDH